MTTVDLDRSSTSHELIEHIVARDLGDQVAAARRRDGVPVFGPTTEQALAGILRTATERGWKVGVAGGRRWGHYQPADLIVTTERLALVTDLRPRDLVATVQTGVSWNDLQRALDEHGMWVPVDPPGTGRTVGSVVGTATAGGLETGFGPVRDQVLGLTVVTSTGRVLRVGGRVVKNVAGFDLTRLMIGSFGAFGILTAVDLRLRVRPASDVTLTITGGSAEDLWPECEAVLRTGLSPAALQLLSPAVCGVWTMAVRLMGTAASVHADIQTVSRACHRPPSSLSETDSVAFWQRPAAVCAHAPITLRVGSTPGEVLRIIDHLARFLGTQAVAAGVTGVIRWNGDTTADRIVELRASLATHGIPVTLERAPWNIGQLVGHTGALRPGNAELVQRVRAVFDPERTLVVPLTPHP